MKRTAFILSTLFLLCATGVSGQQQKADNSSTHLGTWQLVSAGARVPVEVPADVPVCAPDGG